MAIAYESVAVTAYQSSSTLVINKPTGLAVGDLMVSVVSGNTATGFTPPSGWTELVDDGTTTPTAVAYKVATSGDVAASDFTWSCGSATDSGGCIIRISGATTIIANTSPQNDNANGTHTWEAPITPSATDSMLLMVVSTPTSFAASGYAIVTSNPTWTELMDENTTSPDIMLAVAYAIRPQVTSTGNFSATLSSGTVDAVGYLISIVPVINATVSPTVLTVEAVLNSPALGIALQIDPLSLNTVLNSPTVSSPTPDWTNTDKSNSSWTNTPKS